MKQLVLLGAFLITFFKGHTQTVSTDSILHESIYRSYIVHIPASFSPDQSLSLVIALHAEGGSANELMHDSGFNSLADTGNFIVVYPEGYKKSWADGRGLSLADSAGIDDVNFISSLIDTLLLKYHVNSEHIYAAGISNGGFMVQRIACQISNKIAAVASVAASIPDHLVRTCNSRWPVPVLFIDGTFAIYAPSPRETNTNSYSESRGETDILQPENTAADIWSFFKKQPLKMGIRSNSLDLLKTNYNQDLTIYPNPVQGVLFLSYANGSIDHVEIFDHHSKSILYLSGSDITYPINVSLLPKGLYMIKVSTGDGETIKSMMIKD